MSSRESSPRSLEASLPTMPCEQEGSATDDWMRGRAAVTAALPLALAQFDATVAIGVRCVPSALSAKLV